jgi:hypothetical protein
MTSDHAMTKKDREFTEVRDRMVTSDKNTGQSLLMQKAIGA